MNNKLNAEIHIVVDDETTKITIEKGSNLAGMLFAFTGLAEDIIKKCEGVDEIDAVDLLTTSVLSARENYDEHKN